MRQGSTRASKRWRHTATPITLLLRSQQAYTAAGQVEAAGLAARKLTSTMVDTAAKIVALITTLLMLERLSGGPPRSHRGVDAGWSDQSCRDPGGQVGLSVTIHYALFLVVLPPQSLLNNQSDAADNSIVILA